MLTLAIRPCPFEVAEGKIEGMYDLIIRSGNIVDGTGRKTWVGDIAIEDGLIIEAGRKITGSTHREINADGVGAFTVARL